MDFELEIETANEGFKITDDRMADWAVRKIQKSESERDRLVELAKAEIADLQKLLETYEVKCQNDTKYLRSCLAEYFMHVERKETKTQESYKLLHGTLVMKKPKEKIKHDDDVLLQVLEGTPYVKTTKAVNWGEFKKRLTVVGDQVIDTGTGEIVNGCTIEYEPGEFLVKVD